MTEQFEHNIGDHEDPEIGSTWMVGLVGSIILVVIILALTAMYYNLERQLVDERVMKRDAAEVRLLNEAHEAQLNRWWIEEGTDRVGVPIDYAMELYLEEQAD